MGMIISPDKSQEPDYGKVRLRLLQNCFVVACGRAAALLLFPYIKRGVLRNEGAFCLG